MAYLLDANVFIQAKNLHYGMDFCPAFWDSLARQNAQKAVFSIERVADELLAGGDELAEWAARGGERFFLPPDERVLDSLQRVSRSAIRSGGGQHVSSGRGLLPGGPRPRPRVRRRYARGAQRRRAEGQDSQRVHRPEGQMHDPLRNAAPRTGAVCLGPIGVRWTGTAPDPIRTSGPRTPRWRRERWQRPKGSLAAARAQSLVRPASLISRITQKSPRPLRNLYRTPTHSKPHCIATWPQTP